jgi:signal transduction histidine kinase
MIVDDGDAHSRAHPARFPNQGRLMRLTRKRPEAVPALLLLRSVCHEVRPSIATLSSLVRAMDEQPSPDRRTELAGLAGQHATHALTVLAEASAIAGGRWDHASECVPLGQVLQYVAASAPDERVSVAATPGAASWPVHRQHTEQILDNLVGNAVHHSPGAVRLGARLHARRLRLTVADQGGPTRGLLRALRRRTPPPGDDGLGLWLVRYLVNTHGGRLRARRGRPAGLVVEVMLPPFRR